MSESLKMQYANQIEFFVGDIKDAKLRKSYRARLQSILSRTDRCVEVDLVALLNEVEEKEPKKYDYEEYVKKILGLEA